MAGERPSGGRVRRPDDLLFGLFLLALGALGLWSGARLSFGSSLRMGPGFFPTILSALLVIMGLAQLVLAFVGSRSEPLERWHVPNLALVLGSLALFALTLEWLGLVAAVALLVCGSSLAAPDRRWWEIVLFALGCAVAAALLFKTLLGIPVELWPSAWS